MLVSLAFAEFEMTDNIDEILCFNCARALIQPLWGWLALAMLLFGLAGWLHFQLWARRAQRTSQTQSMPAEVSSTSGLGALVEVAHLEDRCA